MSKILWFHLLSPSTKTQAHKLVAKLRGFKQGTYGFEAARRFPSWHKDQRIQKSTLPVAGTDIRPFFDDRAESSIT